MNNNKTKELFYCVLTANTIFKSGFSTEELLINLSKSWLVELNQHSKI